MASVRGILLFLPYDLDTRAVNKATGSRGYGHVAIANGECDGAGRALAIDSSLGRGVFRRPIEMICSGAPWHVVPVPWRELDVAYEAAASKIGSSYNFAGLAGYRSASRWTCSQLVFECLPPRLRERVSPCGPWPISPNCIARCLRGE